VHRAALAEVKEPGVVEFAFGLFGRCRVMLPPP